MPPSPLLQCHSRCSTSCRESVGLSDSLNRNRVGVRTLGPAPSGSLSKHRVSICSACPDPFLFPTGPPLPLGSSCSVRSSCPTSCICICRTPKLQKACRWEKRRRSVIRQAYHLETISKWSDATVYGTIGARMRVVALRGSSTPSCRSEPRPHGIWIAMPASVPQPTGALDTACRQRRPASPHRCVGCAPDSRVQWQPHGLKDCHTLCPDTGVGALPRWAAVVRPQWHPGSPPTAWHRGRLLQQP